MTNIAAGEETVDAITDAMLTASRLLVSLSARSIATVEDTITIAQFRVLVVLDTRGPLNLAALAHCLDVQPSTATRMVDRLVVADMISRQPSVHSRREQVVTLTDHGRGVVGEVTTRRRTEIGTVVAAMPPAQRTGLVRAAERLHRGQRRALRAETGRKLLGMSNHRRLFAPAVAQHVRDCAAINTSDAIRLSHSGKVCVKPCRWSG